MMIYELMDGDEKWPAHLKENWGDLEKDICKWSGIGCDEDGRMLSITLPLFGKDFDKGI